VTVHHEDWCYLGTVSDYDNFAELTIESKIYERSSFTMTVERQQVDKSAGPGGPINVDLPGGAPITRVCERSAPTVVNTLKER
jgi:hypothetical protein